MKKSTVKQLVMLLLALSMIMCMMAPAALASEAIIVPMPSETPEATPSPSPSTDPNSPPKITKHPTGETVEKGGSASFVARAENQTEIIWRLVSGDTTITVPCADASSYFSGLKVSGLGTEKLTLSNIPSSVNGWRVEAKFVGPGGTSYSNGALITVKDATPATPAAPSAPTISSQPKSIELSESGGSISVSASAASGTVKYQWYKNSSNSNSGGTAISGATSSSYSPSKTEGTTYYYAAVWAEKDGVSSGKVYTNAVAVSYKSATQPSASPQPSTDPSASPQPSTSPSPGASTTPDGSGNGTNNGDNIVVVDQSDNSSGGGDSSQGGSSNVMMIVVGVLVALGIGAGVVAIILIWRKPSPKAKPQDNSFHIDWPED